MNQDDETPVWLTILKLVVVAVVLIGGVGLALWYAGEIQNNEIPATTGTGPGDWGIVKDSPIHFRR
jgi:hypothetical protein